MYGQFTNYCAKHNIHDYVNDLLIGDESRFDWTGKIGRASCRERV